jgi:hypothetical protein
MKEPGHMFSLPLMAVKMPKREKKSKALVFANDRARSHAFTTFNGGENPQKSKKE